MRFYPELPYMSYTDKSDWWSCESVKTPDGFKLDMHTCLWKDCCDIAGYFYRKDDAEKQ